MSQTFSKLIPHYFNIKKKRQLTFVGWVKKSKIFFEAVHIGIQLSETEFPKNWLTDGIQIKILFPFRRKPWYRSMIWLSHLDIYKKRTN